MDSRQTVPATRSHWTATPPSASTAPQWYAGRTRPRAEKAVHRMLERQGVESYLPLVERERSWTDRAKRVSLPLFPGYLFLRFRRATISAVLGIPGLMDVVRDGGEPAVVREDELDSVRVLLDGVRKSGELPTPTDYLVVGDPVKVVGGPFAGLSGILIEERGRARVAVRLSVLRHAVSVELDRCWIRPELS
jgi:transcriptional antiterminator NusG